MTPPADNEHGQRRMRCWKCGIRPEGDGPSQLCPPCGEYLRKGPESR